MTIRLTVNGEARTYEGDPEQPLLWYLRDEAGLKGTKFGCGIAQCGACTVHLDGAATRTCVLPMAAVDGASVTTIEGLANEDGTLHPVQQAWVDEDVAQCGYCQAGQIMTAAYLLENNPDPSEEDIRMEMTNLCRCGTYSRIAKGVKRAAKTMQEG
ncbi:MAG: (2Fe-2S)-binding protein [Pacificimonas sp.]|jgi:isoquinoline 1-oxidoreductase alpha subunit|nr:(2Fe-2S)-binding protein [Pacificimonas sp.]